MRIIKGQLEEVLYDNPSLDSTKKCRIKRRTLLQTNESAYINGIAISFGL